MSTSDPLRCMVIDDDAHIRNLICGFLRKRGHKVNDFGNAPQALAQVVDCQPDIVLVDWMMPEMDGIAFLAELDRHSVNFRPVTVMVTARHEESAIQVAIDHGFDDFIQKPFTLSLLSVRLAVAERQALNRRQLLDLTRQSADQTSYLQTLSRNICAGILIIDADTHNILYCNQFASELIGLKAEQITGRVCHSFICPREKGACPISDLRLNVNRRQAVLLTADQKERTIIKTAESTIYNGRHAILETFVDVNELNRAQQELREFSLTMAKLVETNAQSVQSRLREVLPEDQAAQLAAEIGGCLFGAESSIRLVDHYWNLARDLIRLPEELSPATRERYLSIICGMDEALCAAAGSLSRTCEILRWESGATESAQT